MTIVSGDVYEIFMTCTTTATSFVNDVLTYSLEAMKYDGCMSYTSR